MGPLPHGRVPVVGAGPLAGRAGWLFRVGPVELEVLFAGAAEPVRVAPELVRLVARDDPAVAALRKESSECC